MVPALSYTNLSKLSLVAVTSFSIRCFRICQNRYTTLVILSKPYPFIPLLVQSRTFARPYYSTLPGSAPLHPAPFLSKLFGQVIPRTLAVSHLYTLIQPMYTLIPSSEFYTQILAPSTTECLTESPRL